MPPIQIYPTTVFSTNSLTPLTRSYPGYGGDALDDTQVTSVYFMTNLNASGAGSLAAAPNNSYIVPLVAGKVVSDTSLILAQNNVRFLGQLAPGHISINGTTTFNSGQLVRFNGNNALWEFFSLRCSDVPNGVGQSSHKPFTIENNNSGVVLANLSLHYGDDDSGSIWNTTSDVTLYRLLSAHGADNLGDSGNLNYGLFAGGGSEKVTMFQNVMMNMGRTPHIQNCDNAQVVNNITYVAGTDSTSNQIYAVLSPVRTVNVNYTDNLDVRFNATPSNIWTGQGSGNTLELYTNNNQYRNSAGTYAAMGFHTSVAPNIGTFLGSPNAMPTLPAITDLTTLESFLLPKVGNHLYRDTIDDDVISIATGTTMPPVFDSASDYFVDPWPVGPTASAHSLWDQAAVDGISDAAKATFGIAAGTNLLSPNDGRWEAVVDYHTGGLLQIA